MLGKGIRWKTDNFLKTSISSALASKVPQFLFRCIMRMINKLTSFYNIFFRPKKIWQRPVKAEVLVYDEVSLEPLLPYVREYTYTTLALRGESINLQCLFLSAFNPRFWLGDSVKIYIYKYISMVSPKVVITFIDNDLRFYEISNNFPKIKTIFIQNGKRSELRDVFGVIKKNNKYHVDYMLTFGISVGLKYSTYISGKVVPIGSLKNNSVAIQHSPMANTVLFISTVDPYPTNGSAPFIILPDGQRITWEQFHLPEKIVLEFLDAWCFEHNKILKIQGRSFGSNSEEYFFYFNSLSKCTWRYIPKQDIYGSYVQVDMSEIVVFIDSTLGYEALSRGKKTAGFIGRANMLKVESEKFGWPALKNETGPFWTHTLDKVIFRNIMDYLDQIKDTDWDIVRRTHSEALMNIDPGNLKLKTVLESIL